MLHELLDQSTYEPALVNERGLDLQLVTTLEQLAALRYEWWALEQTAGASLPFQTWEWSIAWWAHLREDSRGVRDHLRVCVLRNGAGRVVGIAPLILTERPACGPLRVRFLQFMGADPNITEIRSMLCAPGYEESCFESLREYFATHAAEWDWLAWEGPQNTPVGGASRVGCRKSAFVLELAHDWPTMKSQLGRNVKESLRKCYNSLRRDGLSASMEIVDAPLEIDAALGDFFRLHEQRAALKRAPAHANVFASAEARAFLIDVCHRLADRGVARVFRLRIDHQVVAVRIGFEMSDSLYLHYSGWNAEFGRYSVMTTLLAEIIQHAIARGLRTVNLSTGKDVSKTRWRPAEVAYQSSVHVSPRAASHVRFHGYRAVRSLGASKIVRELMPGFLVRRSEPRGNLVQLPHVPRTTRMPLHAFMASALAMAVLDLLDNVLDHRWLVLAQDVAQYLG